MSGPKGKRPLTKAELDQRRNAARQSRPNRAHKETPVEREGRELAARIYRGLCPRVATLAEQRVQVSEVVQRKIMDELQSEAPDFEHIANLTRCGLTNMDLTTLLGQLEDRHGQPRRSEQDHRFEGLALAPIVLGEEGQSKTWGAKEEEHAGAAARQPPRVL